MPFVDSHCHLDDKQFSEDRDAVLARAYAAGLQYMLSIGTGDGPPDLEVAIRQAEMAPSVWATVGVHPNDAAKVTSRTFPHLQDLLSHPKVVAIGEIGLDYHWGVPAETQEPIFRQQLRMAAEAGVPVIIHTRDAWDDTLAILREEQSSSGSACIMHCFTGNARQAEECLELGCYLAFGGVTTFPKSGAVREAAQLTPLDRLLLETDSPYLAPVPHRGKRNEPSYLLPTAHVLAALRSEPLEVLEAQTTSNFERIFLNGKTGLPLAFQPLH